MQLNQAKINIVVLFVNWYQSFYYSSWKTTIYIIYNIYIYLYMTLKIIISKVLNN